MARAGRAWRGWFPLGGELTSGVPDGKEGIYFGEELPAVATGSCTGRTCSPSARPSCARRCSTGWPR